MAASTPLQRDAESTKSRNEIPGFYSFLFSILLHVWKCRIPWQTRDFHDLSPMLSTVVRVILYLVLHFSLCRSVEYRDILVVSREVLECIVACFHTYPPWYVVRFLRLKDTEIPRVPWKNIAVVDDVLWPILSTASAVKTPVFRLGGHTIPIVLSVHHRICHSW